MDTFANGERIWHADGDTLGGRPSPLAPLPLRWERENGRDGTILRDNTFSANFAHVRQLERLGQMDEDLIQITTVADGMATTRLKIEKNAKSAKNAKAT